MNDPLPQDEFERIASLRSYNILDTPPEPEFDSIAHLAGIICDAPTALVTLIDEHRQWFKARKGFRDQETPRDLAFCAHTILEQDILVVPDAATDPRFSENPLVAGPAGIRFYAGAPIRVAEGHALGSVAVVDYRPRNLDPDQIQALRELSRQAVAQLELRKLLLEQTEHAATIEISARELESLAVAVWESALDASLIADGDGRIIEFSTTAERTFGYEAEEVRGKSIVETLFPTESREKLERLFPGSVALGRGPSSRMEANAQRADGSAFPAELTSVSVARHSQTLHVITVRDVTDRKIAEDAIRREKEFADRAIDSIPGVFYVFDAVGRMIRWNKSLEEIVGYTSDEIVQMKPPDFFDSHELNMVRATISRAFATGKAQVEIGIRHKDGSTRPFLFTGRRITIESRPCILGVGIDLSEQKRAETERENLHKQLMQAQKMESIGRLAGGVAHDFNNMLEVIFGYAELALEKVPPGGDIAEHLSEILDAAGRSADLTRQLLTFARKKTAQPRVINPNDVVESLLKMLRRLIGEDVRLDSSLADGLWSVKVDPAHIDQILVNLCVNARDAIAGTGRIVIETANVARSAPQNGRDPAEFVRLTVTDDGCGMDEATQANIFEPFFTTKGHREGTGLGLSTVYGIGAQYGGNVEVFSRPGEGTAIRVFLPRHVAADEGARPVVDTTGSIVGGAETVLLVEDEPAILKLTRTILERLGYDVLAAATAGEAIKIANSRLSEIQLLLTDIVLPDMNGPTLYKQLRERHKTLGCLYMSGYTPDDIVSEHSEFIKKPFGMNELAAKIRAALDQRTTLPAG